MASLEMVKNNSESLLLFLIGQQPMYGYQIIKELEKRSQGYFVFKEGTLYPALHRLEKSGWLASEWKVTDSRQRAKFYRLTVAGKAKLLSEQARWKQLVHAISGVLSPVATGE